MAKLAETATTILSSAAARDDHRAFSGLQLGEHRAQTIRLRLRTIGRDLRELRLDERVHVRFLAVDLAFIAAELQMHRPGRAGRGRALDGSRNVVARKAAGACS